MKSATIQSTGNGNVFTGSLGLAWQAQVVDKPFMASTTDALAQRPPSHAAYNVDDGFPSRPVNASNYNAWTISLPLFGRMRILKDPTGLILSFIIVLYWVYGNWSTWLAILLPRYQGGQLSVALLIIYAVVSVLCITSFVKVSTMNPGSLSANLQPQEDWNVCQRCFLHRPSTTHHCRRCGHCVRKMDHHCPWINNCVGEDNQFAFLLLIFYAYTLSLMTLIMDIMHLYIMEPCLTCDKESFVVVHQSAVVWTAVAMAALMTCGTFSLYFGQHLSILFDTPSMEWSRIQQNLFLTGKPPVKWPEQKDSVYRVYRTVCGSGPMVLWLCPCRRVQPPPARPQIYV